MSSTLLALLLIPLSTSLAFAQFQQTPSQYAPSNRDFPKSKFDLVKEQTKQFLPTTQGQILSWDPIPLVRKWLIVIALDEDMHEVLHIGESATNSYMAPALPAGNYYFYVDGLASDRLIGRTEVAKFSVTTGSAQENAENAALPAPVLVYPEKDKLFPPEPRMRLLWKSVPGARSYRVEIWEENKDLDRIREKKLPVARWITEVKQNWLEIYDVPYSSYMYLGESVYRWDVTAIDEKTGKLGEMAVSHFEVTSNYFLKKGQLSLEFRGMLAPASFYKSASSGSFNNYEFSNTTSGLRAEMQWWYLRQWGLFLTGGMEFLDLSPAGAPGVFNFGLDLAHRSYLSNAAKGWQLIYALGLGLQEFALVDQAENPTKIAYPQAMGPRFKLALNKRFQGSWEMELNSTVTIPAFTYGLPAGTDGTSGPLNYALGITARLHTTETMNWCFGVDHELKRMLFVPRGSQAKSGASFEANNFEVGLRFTY